MTILHTDRINKMFLVISTEKWYSMSVNYAAGQNKCLKFHLLNTAQNEYCWKHKMNIAWFLFLKTIVPAWVTPLKHMNEYCLITLLKNTLWILAKLHLRKLQYEYCASYTMKWILPELVGKTDFHVHVLWISMSSSTSCVVQVWNE